MVEIYRIKSCLQDYPYTSKGDWEELTELERLAEIGRATEKAFEKDGEFEINLGTHNTFYNVNELVEHFKED